MIIDEAHYFRNKNGDSLRVNAASEFFGDPADESVIPIARRVMLMTATPNHSSSGDIANIVSYFTNRFEGKGYHAILEAICIRRLRRLSEHGFNKYNYRNEIPRESSFKENPLGEIFFGLYQHELAKELNRKKQERGRGRGGLQMMKYLEGVEFIPFEKKENKDEESDKESTGISTDFFSGSDAEMLLQISTKFNDVFGTAPGHPKYNKLVEDLTTHHQDEKAVVFVRRIPSVIEISKRVIDFYDKKMWAGFKDFAIGEIPFEKLDRSRFKKASLDDLVVYDEEEPIPGKEEKEGNMPTSKVLNLFKVIKNDKIKSTQASNFRSRFTHSKPSVFAMFFCPGQNYFNQPYETLISYRYELGADKVENYYNSALIHRTKALSTPVSKDIQSSLLSKSPLKTGQEHRKGPIHTLLTIFWTEYLGDDRIPEQAKEQLCSVYNGLSYYEMEALSNFLEKGILLASEGMVWLYRIFLTVQTGDDDGQQTVYFRFTEKVRQEIKGQRVYYQIIESILHFRQIYTKVFSINGDKLLLEETWDSFNNAQPIYPYNADNSSKKILRCFNTPFFPDFLVATSVLQEGVNLQYFCNTIYHYGMAWTPGDNEQRIGRIDRMFGKIERMLEEKRDSNLHIYYPYLKDTIDEEQLARFVKRKYNEEQLIDLGMPVEEKPGYTFEDNDNNAWKGFLRKPAKKEISDPFPVKQEEFLGISPPPFSPGKYSLETFFYSIAKSIAALEQFSPEIFTIDQQNEQRLLVDPFLAGDRRQPVVIELVYDYVGSGYSGNSVYCLRMKTPIASYSKYKQLKGLFYNNAAIQSLYLPGIKLCMDSSQSGGNNWGLYMVSELPLFIKDLSVNPLSTEEIQAAFSSLVQCADKTEVALFGRDIRKEELNLPVALLSAASTSGFRKAQRQKSIHNWKSKGDYFVLQSSFENSSAYHDMEKKSLQLNHDHFYVKTCFEQGQWLQQVAFLTRDAHQEELDLLEKHYKVFISDLNWD